MFADLLIGVNWVSKINLIKNREDQIKKCFSYTKVAFHYPDDIDNFNFLIEKFQKDTFNDNDKNKETANKDNCNIFGEKIKFDKLIVMDDVSGLADKSNDFSNFLTVTWKFGYICLYIFHTIYPKKSIWEMILSQIKFSIFSPLQFSQETN